jgi:hypothetical protein
VERASPFLGFCRRPAEPGGRIRQPFGEMGQPAVLVGAGGGGEAGYPLGIGAVPAFLWCFHGFLLSAKTILWTAKTILWKPERILWAVK